MKSKLSASLAVFLLFPVTQSLAQVQNARVEGSVHDASGAVIPSAKIAITNTRTQTKMEAEADASGFYTFPLLQPGFYEITAEAAGFRKSTVTNIELNVGVTIRQDIKLELGSIAESVAVEASAVRVQTSEGTIQRAITLRDIDSLPQLTRNPLVLTTYQPGVQINPSDNSFSRVNGLRQGSNNNTLDGIDVNDSVLPRLGLALNPVNTDSVEEFRMITNGAKAEYGRNGGGQVDLITRSGTNDYHGNLFWFHRNTVLNANDFFNNASGNSIRPKFIQNQFGGSIGGPLSIPKVFNAKEKLFFFFNFQGVRTAQQVVRNRTVLTPEAKRGIFRWAQPGTGTIQSFDIPANDPRRIGIDKAVAQNLALLPDPNNLDVGDRLNTAGYRFNAPANSENEQVTAKGDWNMKPTHRVWFRYSRLRTLTPADTLNSAESTFPGLPSGSQGGLRYGWAAGSSWTIKPWLVNEFLIGHSQSSVDFFRVRSLNPGALITSNLFTDPLATAFGSRRNSPVNQVTDNLSILRGKHSFKTGLRFSLTTQFSSNDGNIWPGISLSQQFGNAAPGTVGPSGATVISAADRLRFDNLYNDLLGRVSSINTTFYTDLEKFQTEGTPRDRNFKFRDYGYYFQDDWRIRQNLTLNLGLRWEFYGVPFERDGLQGVVKQNLDGLIHSASFIPDLTVQRGTEWYKNDWNNFAPRVGFAWDPRGDGKTSIRGSWGIFYDRVIGATANDVDGNMPGFSQQVQVFPNQATGSDIRVSDNPTMPRPPAAPVLTLPATRGQATLALFDQNFRTPYVMQMNFTVQREILRSTVLEVGYVGNRGIQQLLEVNYNQPRIYGGFLDAFVELAALRNNTPATNQIVRMFGGNAATAVSTIGATTLAQGAVGTAANTIDTSNYTRYPTGGLSQFYLRNYPQFQTVAVATNAGRTYYNSLQTSIRRQAGAVRFSANYTWSKTIDNSSVDGSGFTAPIDSFNLSLNRALSDIDRPHTFSWTANYFLPFGKGKALLGNMPEWADKVFGGWEVGSLGVWTSGPTTTIQAGANVGPTTTAGNSSANFSGDRKIGTIQKLGSGVRFFTPEQAAQFTLPGAGFSGSSGRNTFRGPSFFNTDLSMVKRFRITESARFTLRAEAYNLLNTPNFATPTWTLATPQSLGVISGTTTGNARVMQMALRFDF